MCRKIRDEHAYSLQTGLKCFLIGQFAENDTIIPLCLSQIFKGKKEVFSLARLELQAVDQTG